LKYVLPPESIKQLSITTGSFPTDLLKNFAFHYIYDGRNRMVAKIVPGADSVFMVYDDRDRLVLTQDGNQKKKGEWLFTKYDVLNRPIMTGIYSAVGESRESLQSLLTGSNWTNNYESFESRDGNLYDYTDESFPISVDKADYLTVAYYDDYDFYHANQSSFQFQSNALVTNFNQAVKGLATGSLTKVIGTNSQWIRAINYYDNKYRLVQAMVENVKGGVDIFSSQFDFTGKVLKTTTYQSKPQQILIKNQFNILPYGDGYKSAPHVTSWDARFSSINELGANEDGWMETRIDEVESLRYFGLSNNDIDGNSDQLFKVYLKRNEIGVYVAGDTYQALTNLDVGDLVKVQRVNGVVSVLLNNELIHTFSTTNQQLLYMDVLMKDNATLMGLKTSFKIPALAASEEKKVYWINLENMTVQEDGTLLKTGTDSWNNNNAASLNVLPAYKNGSFAFTANENNKHIAAGLSDKDLGTGYGDIKYAFHLRADGKIAIRESGNYKGTYGAYNAGDRFEVVRLENKIHYYHNDQLLDTGAVRY
jgi:hypothetical protein